MSYFIIIRGALGCGKTTVAKQLAELLHAEYVSIDEVLEKYGLDKVEQNAECIPVENFIKANVIVLPEVKAKLQKGRAVIFDACFYHKEPIEHLVQNLPFPHYVFTLKAPVEVCIARDRQRRKTHGEDAARAVYSLVSQFDYGIPIDASRTLESTVNAIRSHLPQ